LLLFSLTASTKMGVPARHASKARRAGHRATVPRYRGIGPEAYLNGTSQGELVLSLPKEHPRTHGRTAISVVAVSDS